jgi:hypothetical protein
MDKIMLLFCATLLGTMDIHCLPDIVLSNGVQAGFPVVISDISKDCIHNKKLKICLKNRKHKHLSVSCIWGKQK